MSLVPGLPSTTSPQARWVDEYVDLVRGRLTERGLVVDRGVSAGIRDLGHELTDSHASARVALDVHVAAVKRLLEGASAARTDAVMRVGDSVLIELLGHLGNGYLSRLAATTGHAGGPTLHEDQDIA